MRKKSTEEVTIFRKFLRISKKIVRCFLEKTMNVIIFLSEASRIRFELKCYINRRFDDYCLRHDYSGLISKIFNGKMTHLDVGASAGPVDIVQKYSSFFNVILCEPAKEEAELLRKEGYKVIEKALCDKVGEITLFETRLPYGSSVYKPQGPYLDFYNPDPEYISLFDTVRETSVKCSTISKELSDSEIPELDFLKLDTQGSELDILKGLGDYRPLMIMSEIEYLPLYHGQPNAYDVCQYLFNLGYISFLLTSSPTGNLCPVYGDGYFMPSWADSRGIKLIQSREEKYIALMLMFGQRKILKFVNNKIELKNKDFIEALNGK